MGDRLKYEFRHLGETASAGYNPNYVVQEYLSGADDTVMTFEVNQDDEIERGITENLEAYGATAVYLRDWLIDHINGPVNSVLVRITDNVCGTSRGEWLIKTDSLQWCDDGLCKYRITLKEYAPEETCLKSTLIYDNHRGWFPEGGFITGNDGMTGAPLDPYMHPRFRYCDDIKPQAVQNFLFVIAQSILIAINSVIGPILGIFQVLDRILRRLRLGGLPGFANLQDMYDSMVDKIFGALLGCNRVHPSPLVRNYFENACSKCGLEFSSRILTDDTSDYYNLTHLFAPVKKGLLYDSTKDWIPDNNPVYNLLTYSKQLKTIFNAKYRIRDSSTFIFERKDFFEEDPIFDFTGDDKKYLLGAVCYSWSGKPKPAYQYFKYDVDSFDTDGNEVGHRFNGIKDWNLANNPLLDGEDTVSATGWSPQRYTNDGVDKRVIFKALANQTKAQLDGVLLMSADITSTGKLIIWDTDSSPESAFAIKMDYDTYRYGAYPQGWPDDQANVSGTDYYVFNWPMYYNPEANGIFPNLYQYRYIDDPNQYSRQAKEWSLTMQLCCYVVDKLLIYDPLQDAISAKVDYLIKLKANETGVITKIEIDNGKAEVRITGHIR
jgi:hypothetical protein